MCARDGERDREIEKERKQIDRKSHCGSKQSQITLVGVSHGTSLCGSADTIARADTHILQDKVTPALIRLFEKISGTHLV